MSPRNFARVFAAHRHHACQVRRGARIDAARRHLERRGSATAAIASGSGFGSGEPMRRTFLRHLRIAPVDYRRRFQPSSLERPRAIAARDDPRRGALVRRRSALEDANLAN